MAEPIFIARRIQEIAERHGLQLFLLALDYSKAFDSIPHDKRVESLHRLGAPPKMIRLVEMLYGIKLQEGISDEFEQRIGIRQGCPLSPYLYIIATSCLMTDVQKDWDKEPENQLPPRACCPTPLFADDTVLMSNTAAKMTRFLDLEYCFRTGLKQPNIKYLGAAFSATLNVGMVVRSTHFNGMEISRL